MNFSDYQTRSRATALYPSIGHPVIYPVLGLTNEAGEVAGKIKKVFRDKDGQISPETREALARILELDSDLMHAVMMTSQPPLLYWQSATVSIFHAVRGWRADGLPVAYTVDAGPNVHVICPRAVQEETTSRLRAIPGVSDVLLAGVGGPARLVE